MKFPHCAKCTYFKSPGTVCKYRDKTAESDAFVVRSNSEKGSQKPSRGGVLGH